MLDLFHHCISKFPTDHDHWSQQHHIASCHPWTFLANCMHSLSSSSCYSDLEDGGNMFLTITGKQAPASVIIKNTTAWGLTTLTNRQLILDKQAYLNNKIDQSKINSNGKRQEEIKDGWFNTETHKKWHWLSLISVCSVIVSIIQVKEQKITQILTSTPVSSNIFTCILSS